MILDEGYVKYESHWSHGPAPDSELVGLLERWRRPLYAAGLVGHYEDLGIGYGNISVRVGDSSRFVISGTQTGHLAETTGQHYSLVTAYDIDGNSVHCEGPVQASSESLTHAAIYELSADIRAVVHVHSASLWHELRDRLPTTDPDVAYGTPAMAHEFGRLFRETDFPSVGIAVMAGHEEGLVSIGRSLEEAATRILRRCPEAAGRE